MFTETFAPVNFPVDGSEGGPTLIFRQVTPIYMKVNFLKWCEIGLAEVGASRQLEARVIKHMQTEFIGLINAVYCISMSTGNMEEFDKYLRQYIENYYIKDAKQKEIFHPFTFCQNFFSRITRRSAGSILWLLLEVVTANKEKHEYHLEQKDVLNLYERYTCILDMGDDWQEIADKNDQAK